jgi:hypothetical protein
MVYVRRLEEEVRRMARSCLDALRGMVSLGAFLRGLLLLALAGLLAACVGDVDGTSPPDFAITAQPTDVRVVDGETATFTIVVSGAADLQWQQKRPGEDWADAAGATSATYEIGPVHVADSGMQLRVRLSSRIDPAHQALSSTVTLSVDPSPLVPLIAEEPVDLALMAGQDSAMNVTAIGTSLAYRWQRSADGIAWSDVPGGTAATLLLPAVTPADDGARFQVVVTNEHGDVTSQVARLAVAPAPQAAHFTSVPPAEMAIADGVSATMTATAIGVPAPAIKWQKSPNAITWTDIPGATGATYTTPPLSRAADPFPRYRAIATNASGEVNAPVLFISVEAAAAAPSIVDGPVARPS